MGQKIIGYIRVSCREQNEERQRIALLNMGVPMENIFMDKQSGKDFERPQYKNMMNMLNEDTVLFIKSIDRLGRNYEDLKEQWRIITKEKRADIVVIDMPILDTRMDKNLMGVFIGDVVLALLSYVAENERINIRQRQAEGIAAAKNRGVQFGRPRKELSLELEYDLTLWERKEITRLEVIDKFKISESTFYRRLKEYKSKNG